jgi:hypothetical protein
MASKIVRVVNNKLRGAYGMTSWLPKGKVKIEINKKRHEKISKDKQFPKKERTLINTLVHEEMHAKHPKMHEKTVRKMTAKKVEKMPTKTKKKLYTKYK